LVTLPYTHCLPSYHYTLPCHCPCLRLRLTPLCIQDMHICLLLPSMPATTFCGPAACHATLTACASFTMPARLCLCLYMTCRLQQQCRLPAIPAMVDITATTACLRLDFFTPACCYARLCIRTNAACYGLLILPPHFSAACAPCLPRLYHILPAAAHACLRLLRLPAPPAPPAHIPYTTVDCTACHMVWSAAATPASPALHCRATYRLLVVCATGCLRMPMPTPASICLLPFTFLYLPPAHTGACHYACHRLTGFSYWSPVHLEGPPPPPVLPGRFTCHLFTCTICLGPCLRLVPACLLLLPPGHLPACLPATWLTPAATLTPQPRRAAHRLPPLDNAPPALYQRLSAQPAVPHITANPTPRLPATNRAAPGFSPRARRRAAC